MRVFYNLKFRRCRPDRDDNQLSGEIWLECKTNLAGQGYDGAPVMSGKHAGDSAHNAEGKMCILCALQHTSPELSSS